MFIYRFPCNRSRSLDICINAIIARIRETLPDESGISTAFMNFGGDVGFSQVQKICFLNGENTTEDGEKNNCREEKIMLHSFT